MSKYTPIIGLEIHAELSTATKLFCRCANTSSDLTTPANSAICPVCIGLPGALPVLNRRAVEATLRLGESLGSNLPEVTKWDRKNYFYPDLPKGYQISQYDQPLCQGGVVRWFDRTGVEHVIAITRVHLEEDTGKLVHPEDAAYSLIDYNRSSIPLLELVTEPVIASAEEARQFAEEYQLRLRELGIAEASMEKGQMRCEANISLVVTEEASDSQRRLSGTKVEVKNLNSFRSLERAIAYEIARQEARLEAGEKVKQETRGWNEVKGETYGMRTKESANDYRYFPEPDLSPLLVAELKGVTVLPLKSRYDLFRELLAQDVPPAEVHILLNDLERYRFFHGLVVAGIATTAYALVLQWVNQEPRIMQFAPEEVLPAFERLQAGSLRPALFKEAILTAVPGSLLAQVEEKVAGDVVDDLEGVVARVLESCPEEVARYREGKVQLFGFFVGRVRQSLAGRGDPQAIAETLKRQLD